MKYKPNYRINFLYSVIVLLAVALLVRLYFVQVVYGENYRDEAASQYVSASSIFSRGDIYFTNKDGSSVGAGAAILESGYILSINPNRLKNPEKAYEALSPMVELDKERFLEKARRENDPYEKIAEHIDRKTGKKIRALNILGVGLRPENWRFYPGGNMAAHILGFVGYQGDVLAGRYGLEQYYNDVLSKPDTSLSVNVFASVFATKVSDAKKADQDKRRGEGDLYTTIEPSVQSYLQNTLSDTQQRWKASGVGGIIMDPKSGAIYAMAGLPTYDPNNYGDTDIGLFVNPLTEKVFEMGSIMKALTMAAGLDAGVVTPHTMYNDKGSITLNGSRISNWDFRARGRIDMQTVLNQSLNLGAVFVMQQLGKDAFRKYFYEYGLASSTGIDLPNEAEGLMNNLHSTRELEYATASFGQGIANTPMETIRALASLANGGLLPEPHLMRKIDYAIGPPKEYTPGPERRVLSEKTSETITRMLVGVFDHMMRSRTDDPLEHYSIATKTGTAQIPSSGGGYYENRYLDTWIGYFPAYDPKFIVFLYLKDPKGAMYSSQTLVDPFRNITQFLLNYYEIPPDR